MNDFDEYIRQGEPDKSEKANIWKTAIGLQQVDALEPSKYLIEIAKANIEGDITLKEVMSKIDTYYIQHPSQNNDNRTEEADKVSTRITEILNEQTFAFYPTEYLTIHRRLFQGIYSHAGIIRDYNITIKEWVLNGETVLYASADSLKETLEYDFQQEKSFVFKGLSQEEIIEHITHFISFLWQIHIFGEGNTRTTAIFLIKYLRKLGYRDVNNDLFAEHSWFFRNALVRANYEDLSNGIYKSNAYLTRFLMNLLKKANHNLKNRELHIHHALSDTVISNSDTVNIDNDTQKTISDTVLALITQNSKITAEQISITLKISLSTAKRRIKKLKDDRVIERIGSDKSGYWKVIQK